jgi:dCMP deaminase
MRKRQDYALMETAVIWSELSRCKRSCVGAVIAKDGRIIATGYNGTPPGQDNCCEDCEGNTKQEVLHAEENAIVFCARHGLSTLGCELYTSLSPCPNCARMIAAAGIKRVFYKSQYRDASGIELLEKLDVEVVNM